MPIRPEMRDRYPDDWPAISSTIRVSRALLRCECTGQCGRSACVGRCRNRDGFPAIDTGKIVVLTVAHLNHTPEDCRPENLLAMCQGCHNRYDADERRKNASHTRAVKTSTGMEPLFDEGALVARTEARTPTSRWADPEWLAVAAFQKSAYQMVETQPDIAHNGVIPYRPGRWAKAWGVTVDQLTAALRGLETAHWVTIDEDFGELLLHRHIVDDGVYKQPNVLQSARRSLGEVSSERIRSVLADVVKGVREAFADAMPEASRGVLDAMVGDLSKGTANPSGNQSRTLPGTLPEGFGEPTSEGSGVGVGEGENLQDRSAQGSTSSRRNTATEADETESTPPPKADQKPRPDVDQLCEALVEHRVRLECPRPKITQKWRTAARRLLDLDKVPLDQALAVLDWSQQDEFWLQNIASLPKFREKYADLQIRMRRGGGQHAPAAARRQPWRDPDDDSVYDGRIQ